MTCQHWLDGAYCGAPDARHYLPGPRCPLHTPAALAGRTETVPEWEWGLEAGYARSGWRRSFNRNDTALTDNRARRSGRRANAQQRRGARA